MKKDESRLYAEAMNRKEWMDTIKEYVEITVAITVILFVLYTINGFL